MKMKTERYLDLFAINLELTLIPTFTRLGITFAY